MLDLLSLLGLLGAVNALDFLFRINVFNLLGMFGLLRLFGLLGLLSRLGSPGAVNMLDFLFRNNAFNAFGLFGLLRWFGLLCLLSLLYLCVCVCTCAYVSCLFLCLHQENAKVLDWQTQLQTRRFYNATTVFPQATPQKMLDLLNQKQSHQPRRFLACFAASFVISILSANRVRNVCTNSDGGPLSMISLIRVLRPMETSCFKDGTRLSIT